MCLSDNRIMQFFVGRQHSVVTAVGITTLLSPSKYRVGFSVYNDAAGSARFGPDPLITSGSGMLVNPTGAAIQTFINWSDWGGVVQQEWFTVGGGVGNTIGVTEILCPPQFWDVWIGLNKVDFLPRIS